MKWLISIGSIAALAALLARILARRSASDGNRPRTRQPDRQPAGSADSRSGPMAAAGADARPAAAQPAVPSAAEAEAEPIDGWTESAAETAHYDPEVEDTYIEDLSAEEQGKPPLYDNTEWRPHRNEAVVETKDDPVDHDGHRGRPAV